ncbi:hypothetical protein PsorP6_008429 [Peronosclerospora sorghi]|uniref:Uncharacterized protein n=1 Tax=Peronosclerospora sorghi TaxID=230839 RepID=A0ACC0WCV2_9STRA|nr:hypothetical protein PsorP6_008429 [Peronosclerospora sorghi]
MITSELPFTGPVSNSQPFLFPAFAVPRRQQSLSDYSPHAIFVTEPLQHKLQQAANQSQHHPMRAFSRNIDPKLPSLEGLLKQMHTTSQTDSAATLPQQSRLSCEPCSLTPVPSLRTVISPSMFTNVQDVRTIPMTSLPSVTVSPQAYPQSTSSPSPTFPTKWGDATPAQQLLAFPTNFQASPSGQRTYRSRTSKYCKIEGCERVSQRNNLCHSHGGKRLCKEEGCSSKDRGNGFCIKHGGGKICSMVGCEKKARRKGLCTQHFRIADEHNLDIFVSSTQIAKQTGL